MTDQEYEERERRLVVLFGQVLSIVAVACARQGNETLFVQNVRGMQAQFARDDPYELRDTLIEEMLDWIGRVGTPIPKGRH